MKDSLNNSKKKLKEYSVLAGAFLGMAGVTNAQIVYTDINPDVTLATDGDFYILDLNNDGVNDFRLEFRSVDDVWIYTTSYYSNTYVLGGYQANAIEISPLFNNAIAGAWTYFTFSSYETVPVAYNLNAGVPIDQDQNWKVSDNNILAGEKSVWGMGYYDAQYGPWENQSDKYLGLKLKVTGQTFYGWARLDVASFEDDLVTIIKDYAFQSQAGTGISAGSLTNIDKNTLRNKISIYGFDNTIYINAKGLNGLEGEISVFNDLGQNVKESKIIDSQTTISINNPNNQLYLVNVKIGNAIISKKLILGN